VRIGRFSGALPLVLMTVLILAVGAFATVRQDAFLTSFNLNNLLLLAMPLTLVSLGQTCALLVGGFDVSVAALMTFCVVVASYTMAFDKSGWALVPGGLVLLAVGLGTGLFNAVMIRVLKLPSIIATLGRSASSRALRSFFAITPKARSRAMPSASHEKRQLRPDCLRRRRDPRRPRDVWLYRTRTGLAMRAVGLDETSSRRLGMATGRVVVLAFVLCSLMASLAGFYLAAQVQIGSPLIGNYALESIARGRPGAERVSPAGEGRSSERCSRRCSSRWSTTCCRCSTSRRSTPRSPSAY